MALKLTSWITVTGLTPLEWRSPEEEVLAALAVWAGGVLPALQAVAALGGALVQLLVKVTPVR